MTTTHPLRSEAASTAGTTGAGGDSPAPEAGADAPRRGRLRIPGPLLPQRLRPLNRPKLWLEIALIAVSYYLYSLTRLAAPGHKQGAVNRGWAILHAENWLHIDFEHSFNHWVYSMKWLAFSMNVYYGTIHFIAPIAILIWAYVKFPDRYRTIRTVMFAMTGLALIGFYFYSLCPPRLLPDGGFIDTFKLLNPWGQTSATSDGVAGFGSSTNEYAAMPSLHIGWSTWCALAVAHLAQRKWVKVLGVLYPFATFAVIIGTANHYVLDAVGGLVVLALGFLVQRLLQGRPCFAPALPQDADGSGPGKAGEAASLPRQAADELVRPGLHVQA